MLLREKVLKFEGVSGGVWRAVCFFFFGEAGCAKATLYKTKGKPKGKLGVVQGEAVQIKFNKRSNLWLVKIFLLFVVQLLLGQRRASP